MNYKTRYDKVAKILHQELAVKYRLAQNKVQYRKYTPEKVLESDSFKIYWDRSVITDKEINCNRPDTTVLDKES